MKASDLMVGDFVNVNDLSLRVGAIRQDELGFFDNDYKIYWCSDDEFDRIDPIPLTEDILVKNGFEKTTNDWNRHGRPLIIFESMGFPTISIHADMDMKHFWVHGTIDLTYVHTLQHLLRLCGIEKELVID